MKTKDIPSNMPCPDPESCKHFKDVMKLEAENKELKEIILTTPGNDEEDFLSKHRIWWDLHYRELRSPGCNLPRSTFKQLRAKLDTSEAENKSQAEHIELLNQCDDSSTEVIGKMDKELEVKDERIEELETTLIDLRTIALRKFSQAEMQCLLLQNIEQALKK